MIRALVVVATLTAVTFAVIRFGDRLVDWLDRGNDPTPEDSTGLAYLDALALFADPNDVIPPRHPDDTDCRLNLHEQAAWDECVADLTLHRSP